MSRTFRLRHINRRRRRSTLTSRARYISRKNILEAGAPAGRLRQEMYESAIDMVYSKEFVHSYVADMRVESRNDAVGRVCPHYLANTYMRYGLATNESSVFLRYASSIRRQIISVLSDAIDRDSSIGSVERHIRTSKVCWYGLDKGHKLLRKRRLESRVLAAKFKRDPSLYEEL